jgi:hypothetical protein
MFFFCPGWLQTMILSISASPVAGIIGVSHCAWPLVTPFINEDSQRQRALLFCHSSFKVHPFKVYNSVAFSIFPRFCSYHYLLILECFHQ